jgi:hypothetical protein
MMRASGFAAGLFERVRGRKFRHFKTTLGETRHQGKGA